MVRQCKIKLPDAKLITIERCFFFILTSILNKMQKATLAGGCFWCTEAVFDSLKGVQSVRSGYIGGHTPNPTYNDICTGMSGHAEAIEIVFDENIIVFEDLLEVFWHTHNPTTLNQQGNDRGTQYRSAIYYHDENQKHLAEASKEQAEKEAIWPDPIVTEITEASPFFPAEEDHNNYYQKVGDRNPYCTVIITPKIRKLQKQFQEYLK